MTTSDMRPPAGSLAGGLPGDAVGDATARPALAGLARSCCPAALTGRPAGRAPPAGSLAGGLPGDAVITWPCAGPRRPAATPSPSRLGMSAADGPAHWSGQ
jgi:hypothetical protein